MADLELLKARLTAAQGALTFIHSTLLQYVGFAGVKDSCLVNAAIGMARATLESGGRAEEAADNARKWRAIEDSWNNMALIGTPLYKDSSS